MEYLRRPLFFVMSRKNESASEISEALSPLVPWGPDYNLHVLAGGSLPHCFAASNVRERSLPSREACNPQREIGVPYK